ncbi:smallish isoform X2 [Rhodnius prolixus]|uniref:smallish isoform X2 n=1 Tax=Rhodnius prolixus TaxID=13249 RepID=UPI003D18B941
MERRHSTTSDSSTDSRQSICDGLEGAPGRAAKATSPKVAVNPLQFVKVGPCDLYRSAQEQLKKVEEIKKAKKEQKDDIEDWQSNLDNWKCSRRKRQEHIIERVVEVKKFEIEEQERNRRRSKTFNEMLLERNTRGRKTSLPVYHNDEADDLSDLGIGCKNSDSDEMPTVDNNVAVYGDEEKYQFPVKSYAENNSECSDSSVTPQEEYTYERAIQSYVNYTETRVKSRSLKELNDMKSDKNVKASPPVPLKPAHISLNKGDAFLNNIDHQSNTKGEMNAAPKKLVVPKVDVNRRRELFEKIQENDEITKSQKTLHEVPTTRTIKERLHSLERQESVDSPKENKNNLIGSDKLVKERLQTIQTMAYKQPVNKKFNEPISSLSLKDRLSNFVKPEHNSSKKQPVIESSVSIKERLNNLQTSINKEPIRTVVSNPAPNFNEKLATFKEGSSKSELYDAHRKNNYERSYSPSSDVCNSRRHFRHRSLDSLDVDHDSIANVSFERVQSLEDLDYCRNYPPSTFSGDTDREDSGIHTADVSSSVSQADDYDLHLVTNTLEDIKINHHTNSVDDNKHKLSDCSAYRCDDFPKTDSNVSAQYTPSLDTKLQHLVEDISSFNANKSLTSETTYISQALPSIPESSSELTLNAVILIDCANVNSLPETCQLDGINLDSSDCSLKDDVEQKTENMDKYLEHSNLTEVIVNKLDEAAFHNNSLPAFQQNCKNNCQDLNCMENDYIQEAGNNAINTFLDLNNPNHSVNDLLNSDVPTSVNTSEKYDETKNEVCKSSDIDELNNIVNPNNIVSLNQDFITNEKLQEELQNEHPIIIEEKHVEEKDLITEHELKSNLNTQENHLVEQLDSGEFMSSGCMSAEDQQMDGILINMDTKVENNCLFSLSPAVLEPPKEKPPPPPVENSDEENETKPTKKTSLWRADSTKRIKKEIRQKRSSFLGIEGSSDDSYLEPELELIKPPDMSALLAEERRMERQLYRQSVCSESDSNQESRDSGVELDHKHQDVWSHSRNDSETYGNQSTTSDEDEIMKKEREIIETLEKEEKIRKQDLGEKLAMRLRELEAKKERIEWEQLNKENARTHHTSNIYPEEKIHIAQEPSLSEDRMRFDTNFHHGNNVIKTDWYDQRSSLQDITQKEEADINGGVFHDEQQYRLECRKSLQDLSRVISGNNHMQKSKQNLYHRRSMPNLQENTPRRPPPPPPVLPASQLGHPNINNLSNHNCSQQMTKQTLHALSAAPRSRLISNETWQAKRKQRPDNYNYQHWLIQEAEHRRITEQQQRQTVTARRPIPSQHAYITPTNQLSNQQYSNQWTKNPSQSPLYNTSWSNQNSTQRNRRQQKSNGKPLPDSIIQTLTQRVQHKMNPDSNNNRRRKDIKGSEMPHPPLQTDSAKDKMLSVSGKKRCSHCGEELGRGAAMIIESLQLFYHIDCFKCCVCCLQLGDGLMGTDVRVRNNKLHCHNCYSSDDGAKFSCV